MRKRILITSALPYANGPIHFGHIAGAYLPGDCYARFQRLLGNEVLYLSGSDEHGVAITLSAELAGCSPKEHVDRYHEINKKFFEKLNFSFDYYSRTTWPGHYQTTQEFFRALERKNVIEEREENHLYSEKEKRFLADRYVVGTCPKCGYPEARGDECQQCASSYEATDLKNPRSKLTGSELILKPSRHLYMRFDLFRDRLKGWLSTKHWKENVLRFALSYVEDLHPRAITRDSNWGIPVPGYPNKVFYVWFDAPIGYISAAKEWAEKRNEPNRWKDFWLNSDTKLVHFIGKDNIPFHAVFFPAMLMGQDLPYKLPDDIPANEFYLLEGRQFSKSENWTIDLDDFFHHYTPDQIRFSIAASAPETSDSEFTWRDFQSHCNAQLLGKLGNFVHRTLTFAHQHCSGLVPARLPQDIEDTKVIENVLALMSDLSHSFETYQLRKACQIVMEIAQHGNAYFDLKKPWVLCKNQKDHEKMNSTIATSIQIIQYLALASSPIIPETSQKIWEMIGYTSNLSEELWERIIDMPIQIGQRLRAPVILFRKIEDEEIHQQIQKLKGAPLQQAKIMNTPLNPLQPTITIDQFDLIDLRVGQILSAENVIKSKKLLKLTVDLGFEKRTIVSGIAQSVKPEDIVGKKVIVVANLAKAKIMGIESEGMVLAASLDATLELPQLRDLPPGAKVS